MKLSYTAQKLLAQSGHRPSDSTPHQVGLYGALAGRYVARKSAGIDIFVDVVQSDLSGPCAGGVSASEYAGGQLWGELGPFLAMNEADSVEALAEYVVFQERQSEARREWLSVQINWAIRGLHPGSTMLMVSALAMQAAVPWADLLEPDVRTLLTVELNRRFRASPE